MSVTTKLEVEYSQFKKGMAEAQASVKTLDAELKLSEAQFNARVDEIRGTKFLPTLTKIA